MLERRLNELKHTNVLPKWKEIFVSKFLLKTDLWIELYGIITQSHSLLHLILLYAKTLSDIQMVHKTKL